MEINDIVRSNYINYILQYYPRLYIKLLYCKYYWPNIRDTALRRRNWVKHTVIYLHVNNNFKQIIDAKSYINHHRPTVLFTEEKCQKIVYDSCQMLKSLLPDMIQVLYNHRFIEFINKYELLCRKPYLLMQYYKDYICLLAFESNYTAFLLYMYNYNLSFINGRVLNYILDTTYNRDSNDTYGLLYGCAMKNAINDDLINKFIFHGLNFIFCNNFKFKPYLHQVLYNYYKSLNRSRKNAFLLQHNDYYNNIKQYVLRMIYHQLFLFLLVRDMNQHIQSINNSGLIQSYRQQPAIPAGSNNQYQMHVFNNLVIVVGENLPDTTDEQYVLYDQYIRYISRDEKLWEHYKKYIYPPIQK